MGSGAQELESSFAAFPDTQQGSGSKVEQTGLEPALIQAARTVGSSLIYYAMALVQAINFLSKIL